MLPPDALLDLNAMPLPLPQRRHRKMLKDGTSEVWPQDAEDVFLNGLRDYWSSPWANFSRGRSRWRNQYLVDYLAKNGIQRSKKQVASHIQVLRNMWKGHPQYNLVAGPEEMSDSSTTSDRLSPTRSSHTRSTSIHTPTNPRSTPTTGSRHVRRNSNATSISSPPSTPPSHDSDLSDASPAASHLYHPLQQLSPTLHQPHIKSEPFFDSGVAQLAPIPEIPPVLLPNRVSGLCLWADPAEPMYIDVDELPFVAIPASPAAHSSSPFPPSTDPASPFQQHQRKRVQQGGAVRASLRVKLAVPPPLNPAASPTSHAHAHSGPVGGGGSADALQGFSGAVSFSRPLPSSAKVITRVHLDGIRAYQDVGTLVSVSSSADFADSNSLLSAGGLGGQQERHVALLPDSWLTRCKLLLSQRPRALHHHPTSPTSPTCVSGIGNSGGPGTTLITQQVVVDEEALFVVIYDLSTRGLAPHDRMRSSLVHWSKHVDGPAPAPALAPLPLPLPLAPTPYSHPQQQQMGYGMSVGMARFGMTGSSANDYLYSTAANLDPWSTPAPQSTSTMSNGNGNGLGLGVVGGWGQSGP